MSSIPHSEGNGNEISNSVTNFMNKFQIGKILFKCNAGKAKGIPVIEVFRYLFCLIFSERSMYMQRKTGIFDGSFCKNTVYRFLNNAKINWSRFTTLLSSRIINDFMKPLTDKSRKDVFIIDDSLFDRSRSKKTELLAKVFDHCSMKYKNGYRMLTLGRSDGLMGTPLFQSTIVFCRQPMIKICSAKLQTLMDVLLPEKGGNNPDVKQHRS